MVINLFINNLSHWPYFTKGKAFIYAVFPVDRTLPLGITTWPRAVGLVSVSSLSFMIIEIAQSMLSRSMRNGDVFVRSPPPVNRKHSRGSLEFIILCSCERPSKRYRKFIELTLFFIIQLCVIMYNFIAANQYNYEIETQV